MGRISIFTLLFTLSDFSAPRKCAIDTDDPLGVVVGLIWLNHDKPVIYQSLMGEPMLTRPTAHIQGVCTQREGSLEDLLHSADAFGSTQS